MTRRHRSLDNTPPPWRLSGGKSPPRDTCLLLLRLLPTENTLWNRPRAWQDAYRRTISSTTHHASDALDAKSYQSRQFLGSGKVAAVLPLGYAAPPVLSDLHPAGSMSDHQTSSVMSYDSYNAPAPAADYLLGLVGNETLTSTVALEQAVSDSSNSTNNSSSSTDVKFVLIAIFGAFFSIVTIVGNLMVMISFKMDKQLQTISNYFLLSLAIADFSIGVISMPFFTYYSLYNYWHLGAFVCDAWLAWDYLASNASVLNLLIISFDRYFSVTRPLTYRARRTTRRAAIMIASAWLISLLLWPPWIYAWPYIEGKRSVPEGQCYIQFLETNIYVTFGTAIAAFYVPVCIMCTLYWRIWRETEKRQRDLTHLQAAGKKPLPLTPQRPANQHQASLPSFGSSRRSTSSYRHDAGVHESSPDADAFFHKHSGLFAETQKYVPSSPRTSQASKRIINKSEPRNVRRAVTSNSPNTGAYVSPTSPHAVVHLRAAKDKCQQQKQDTAFEHSRAYRFRLRKLLRFWRRRPTANMSSTPQGLQNSSDELRQYTNSLIGGESSDEQRKPTQSKEGVVCDTVTENVGDVDSKCSCSGSPGAVTSTTTGTPLREVHFRASPASTSVNSRRRSSKQGASTAKGSLASLSPTLNQDNNAKENDVEDTPRERKRLSLEANDEGSNGGASTSACQTNMQTTAILQRRNAPLKSDSERSFSTESVYTILIRFPTQNSVDSNGEPIPAKASIKMILGDTSATQAFRSASPPGGRNSLMGKANVTSSNTINAASVLKRDSAKALQSISNPVETIDGLNNSSCSRCCQLTSLREIAAQREAASRRARRSPPLLARGFRHSSESPMTLMATPAGTSAVRTRDQATELNHQQARSATENDAPCSSSAHLATKFDQKGPEKAKPKKKRKHTERKQERKAAKTLSAILFAFIVTWTPYNVLVLIKTLSPCDNENKCIPPGLWSFAYCLCYINSTVNPLCYALCNANFRRTYIRILSCKWQANKQRNRGYFS